MRPARLRAASALIAACAASAHADRVELDFDDTTQGHRIRSSQIIGPTTYGVDISAILGGSVSPLIIYDSSLNTNTGLKTPGSGLNNNNNNNNTPEGNVLIVPRDPTDANGDGRVENQLVAGKPHGNGFGGIITFAFNQLHRGGFVTLLDIDEDEPGGYVRLFRNGQLVLDLPQDTMGNDSKETLGFGDTAFDTVVVGFAGSGGVARLLADDGGFTVPSPAALPVGLALLAGLNTRRRRV